MRFGVRSRRVVTPEGVRPGLLVIDDGRIARTAAHDEAIDGLDIEDVGDHVVMAGLVDCHVHVNEPGRTEWEGFDTATRAAAGGGVTTIVDMPLNCIPVTTTRAALEEKLDACSPQLWVDCAFWGGVVPGNASELPALTAAGVMGAKCFLVHSGIDEFPNVTESDLRAAMPILRDAGVPLLVHAELDLDDIPEPSGDARAYQTYLASRPQRMEDAAIALMIDLCRETGCAVHIVHLSSETALPMIRDARAEGLPLTVETCPHYLCLSAEEVPDGATVYKCAPPIRSASNRDGLWEGLRNGDIDLVISDHSPCTPHLKLPERGDFMDAWGGISSLGLGLPSIWTEASRRGFAIDDVARWMCEKPAELIGAREQKGRLAPGLDADFIVWDPDEAFVVEPKDLRHRHKVSPYLGKTLRGRVLETWLRGRRIADRGELISARPLGNPVLRTAE